MGKRRPSGDGMVRKREDGRWEGRIVVGHKESGELIFRYLSAKTQKELLKKLHQNIEEYRDPESFRFIHDCLTEAAEKLRQRPW